jgi:hypothetical protein
LICSVMEDWAKSTHFTVPDAATDGHAHGAP